MNKKEKVTQFSQVVSAGLLLVLIILVIIGVLPLAMGFILAVFSFGSIMWIAVNEKDEDEL